MRQERAFQNHFLRIWISSLHFPSGIFFRNFRVKNHPAYPTIYHLNQQKKTSFCQAAGLNLAGISALCFSISWSPGVFKERSNSKTSVKLNVEVEAIHPRLWASNIGRWPRGHIQQGFCIFYLQKRVVTKSPTIPLVVSLSCHSLFVKQNVKQSLWNRSRLFLQINEPKRKDSE